MKSRHIFYVAAIAAFVVLTVALFGCSSSDNPTGPYGGGGNQGGGTAFNSGTMTAPAQYVHTFATAGAVGYHCNFHRTMGMVGTVTVAAGGADSAVVTASGMTFVPATVTVKPGGYVHWKVTGGTHTVTSD